MARWTTKITGNRGTVDYLSLGTKAGSYATTGSMEPTGQLDATDLALDENGDFEVILSSRPHPGNWLPMREDSESLIVRQTLVIAARKALPVTALRVSAPKPTTAWTRLTSPDN